MAESRQWRILNIIPASRKFNRRPIMGSRSSVLIHSRKDKFSLCLNRLNNNKTTCSDGIPAKVLKIEAEELSKPLTTLFNSCRANSVWTSDWNRGDWTRKKTRSPRRTIDQSPSSYV